MRAILSDGSFFVPKGALADPRDARNRESSASGAARRRGILSFSKESIPLKPPRERTRGLPPRPRCIGSFRLEELRGLRNRVRCTWLRHGSLHFVTTRNRALLREARVTIARRRTACWRHCCARRGWDRCFSISTAFFSVSCPQLLEYAPDSCEIWQK